MSVCSDGLTVSCDISEDEELFMGQGDYQFDIYRLMRQENGSVCLCLINSDGVVFIHNMSLSE